MRCSVRMAAPWLLIGSLVGCSEQSSAIHGEVTLDGQAVQRALIRFVPLEEGRRKSGAQVRDGSYQLTAQDGLLPGDYRVEILEDFPLSFETSETPPKPPRPLPSRYAEHSPLRITVGPGDEEFNFPLSTSGEPANR